MVFRLKSESEYLKEKYGIEPKGLGTMSNQNDAVERLRNRDTFSDAEFDRFLETKKILSRRASNEPRKERTPTFYEMGRVKSGEEIDFSFSDLDRGVLSRLKTGSSIPTKKVDTEKWKGLKLPSLDKEITSGFFQKDEKTKGEATRDFLDAFFTGGKESRKDKTINPDNVPAVTGGALGFLYGTILTNDETEQAERYEKLLRNGVSPEKAYDIASAWSTDKLLPPGTTEDERKMMRNYSIGKGVFVGLELLDLLLIGKPINTAFKGLARGTQKALFTRLAETTSMVEARSILKAQFPELAGTEGADELIRIARSSSNYDSWKKTLADTKTGKEILAGKRGAQATSKTTEAQTIFYENGIPVLKAGQASDNVNDIVSIREEITSAVKGEMEGRRLSTDDILNDEIKAGSLPFRTAADGKIDVFTTRNVTNPSLGERVALTEGIAKTSLQAGENAKKISVKVDDLVRLDDGTFVYAPKKAVTEGFSPQIKAVQSQMRQRVLDKEKMQKQLKRDIQTTERQLQEGENRIARIQAEEVVKRNAAKIRDAKEILEKGDKRAAEVVENIDKKADELVSNRLAARDKAKKAYDKKKAEVDKLVKKVGEMTAKRPKIVEETKAKIKKLREQKVFPKTKFLEDMPPDLQRRGTELDIREEALKNDQSKWLKKYLKRNGTLKGEFTDEITDINGRSIDDLVTHNSEGKYNSLEEVKEAYEKYEKRKKNIKVLRDAFKEDKLAWEASAKDRASLNLESYRSELIQNAKAQGEAALKQNIRAKNGMESEVRRLRGEMAEIKANTPEFGKTKQELKKPITLVAGAKKAAVKQNIKNLKGEARTILKESGEEVTVKEVKKEILEKKSTQVQTITEAKTEYKQGVKEIKEYEKSVPDTPKANFDPVESDGKLLSTRMNEDIARRTGYEEGVPPEFRQATIKKEYRELNLKKDQENAVKMVINDPIDTYQRFINGEKPREATRASIGNALISHPKIASSPFRLNEVYRALQGTREAQEFVARRNIGDLDVVNFINKLNERGDAILAKRGVDLDKEIESAWKAVGLDKAVDQKAISKKSVEKVLKSNIC